MTETIEFDKSAIMKKYTIRTKGIILNGRGIKNHHLESKSNKYNVYSLTDNAFKKVYNKYENIIKLMD